MALPVINAPPCINTITGKSSDFSCTQILKIKKKKLFFYSSDAIYFIQALKLTATGVNTFKYKQSSEPVILSGVLGLL